MKRILSYIFWTGSAIFAGIFFFNLLFQGGHLAYSKLKEVVIKTNTTSLSAETINHNIPIEVKKPPEITLAFVGDIMLDRGVESSVKKNLNNDFNRVFENVSFLKDYDILFGSLEGSASNEGANTGKKYSFRMDPLVLPAIKNAGFDILNLANNHADDWGRASFDASLINLEINQIPYTGAGNNLEDAKNPTIIEKDGIKIGYLGFSDFASGATAKENRPGILMANIPDFDQVIEDASKQVDYLVVTFHYGEEYKYLKHTKRQEELSKKAIDNGAKIVIGHHPHVIEDSENYNGGIIFYSLGNFIFDQYFSKNTMEGLLVEIKINKDQILNTNQKIIKLNKYYQPEDASQIEVQSLNTDTEIETEPMVEEPIKPTPIPEPKKNIN